MYMEIHHLTFQLAISKGLIGLLKIHVVLSDGYPWKSMDKIFCIFVDFDSIIGHQWQWAIRLGICVTEITQIVLSYLIMVFQGPVATLRYLFTNTLNLPWGFNQSKIFKGLWHVSVHESCPENIHVRFEVNCNHILKTSMSRIPRGCEKVCCK